MLNLVNEILPCMRKLFLSFLFILMWSIGIAQQKVANYFTGKYGTEDPVFQ